MPYQSSITVWYVPAAVYKGYAHAGKPVGSPESAVTSGEFSKWRLKGTASCSVDSFVVLKCHTIYTIWTCCTAVQGCPRWLQSLTYRSHVWSRRSSGYRCPCVLFIFLFFFFSKPSAVSDQQIIWLFSLSSMHIRWDSALISSFLASSSHQPVPLALWFYIGY